jgi:hypothetical protein
MATSDAPALSRDEVSVSPTTETEAHTAVLDNRLSSVALAAALVPLAVAAVRGITRGWVPVGDVATIGVRTRDVLGGGELPLIGPAASSSWSTGIYQNHPGPVFYDALAVPAALFPGPTGLIVGTVLLEALAVLGIFVLARRRGGPLLALAAMAMTAVLCWSMGSAVLVEAWPPNTLLLPVVCFLLLVWSVLDGDVPCLPWLVGVGSFIVQTNMSYGVLVPVLMVVAVAGLVVRWRRGELGPFRWVGWVGRATGAVLVIAWIQPLIEQARGTGEGNLSRVARGLGEGGMTLDWRSSLQVVARVLALPPWWARPSYDDDFRFGVGGNPLPDGWLALLALGLVGALLLWCLRQARRGGDGVSTTGLATAAGLVVLTLVTANQTPSTPAGTVAYQLRWLWPVALFVWLVIVSFGLRRRVDGAAGRSRMLPVALMAATVGVAALNLSWTNQGTTATEAAMPVARDLVRSIDYAEIEGPVLVESDEGIWDPYSEAVLFELQHQGIDFVVHDRTLYRMLGEDRRWNGHNAVARVQISTSDWAMLPRPGARLLARHPAFDQATHDEMYLLQEDIKEAFADGELRLNERGRAFAEDGGLESVDDSAPDQVDPDTVTETRFLPFGVHRRDATLMIHEDLLDAPADWAAKLERYAALSETWDSQTVAVFLEPTSPTAPAGG